MLTFSQKYGYSSVDRAFIRECMPEEIQNSIINAYDVLEEQFKVCANYSDDFYKDLQKTLWIFFLNQRLQDFEDRGKYVLASQNFIEDAFIPWYQKLDMIEYSTKYLIHAHPAGTRTCAAVNNFIHFLNQEFSRHNYAYRILTEGHIVEINSSEEIKEIEQALNESPDNIKLHLERSLDALCTRPQGDFITSIKESISAVEAWCRERTGESTLGKALGRLENKGLIIPGTLKSGFEKLYAYTNDPKTGIRHALMDVSANYVPSQQEAQYMLIMCSAFLNYVHAKIAQ